MNPKQALITGAASGLGLELCRLLAAFKGMMKGRIRVIPGFSNKLLALALRLLPRNVMLAALRRIQENIRKKEYA